MFCRKFHDMFYKRFFAVVIFFKVCFVLLLTFSLYIFFWGGGLIKLLVLSKHDKEFIICNENWKLTFPPSQNDTLVECDGALAPPDPDVCVVMFSLLNRSSFQYAKRKVQDLRRQHNGQIAILLIGNKADAIQSRRVPSKGTVRIFNEHIFTARYGIFSNSTFTIKRSIFLSATCTAYRSFFGCWVFLNSLNMSFN